MFSAFLIIPFAFVFNQSARRADHPFSTAWNLEVNFNSVQLDTSPPSQAYAFGIFVTDSPGFSITSLLWDFGDGWMLDVSNCCQGQVSEFQYHADAQAGSYKALSNITLNQRIRDYG
jgi:hypothetical protein